MNRVSGVSVRSADGVVGFLLGRARAWHACRYRGSPPRGQHGTKCQVDGEAGNCGWHDSRLPRLLWNISSGQSDTNPAGAHDKPSCVHCPFASQQQGFRELAVKAIMLGDAKEVDAVLAGLRRFSNCLVSVNGGGSVLKAHKVRGS